MKEAAAFLLLCGLSCANCPPRPIPRPGRQHAPKWEGHKKLIFFCLRRKKYISLSPQNSGYIHWLRAPENNTIHIHWQESFNCRIYSSKPCMVYEYFLPSYCLQECDCVRACSHLCTRTCGYMYVNKKDIASLAVQKAPFPKTHYLSLVSCKY